VLDEHRQPGPVHLHALKYFGCRQGERGVGQRSIAPAAHLSHGLTHSIVACGMFGAARFGLQAHRIQVIQLGDGVNPAHRP